jgi:hypothetical protein
MDRIVVYRRIGFSYVRSLPNVSVSTSQNDQQSKVRSLSDFHGG